MIIIQEDISKVNTEILPLAIEYISKIDRVKDPMIFLGSWAYNLREWLRKKHPEIYSGIRFKKDYDYEEMYDKNWFKITFYKAIEDVYGKSFLKQIIKNNKKS